jgi:hypothetical protein
MANKTFSKSLITLVCARAAALLSGKYKYFQFQHGTGTGGVDLLPPSGDLTNLSALLRIPLKRGYRRKDITLLPTP